MVKEAIALSGGSRFREEGLRRSIKSSRTLFMFAPNSCCLLAMAI